jgi:hypothetical protein
MATYYSNIYRGPQTRGVDTQTSVVQLVGKLKLPSGVAPLTGDVLKLARIPEGVYITKFRIWNSDWGSSAPGKIGLATQDDDAIHATYAFGTSALTAGKTFRNDETAGTSDNTAAFATDLAVVSTSGGDDLQVTLGTVSTGTAGAYLTFQCEYINLNNPDAGTIVYDWNGKSSL